MGERDEITLTRPLRRFICFTAVFTSALFAGCSYVRHDWESASKFAKAYVAFQGAVRDSEILSWVIALDQSGSADSEVTLYRKRFYQAYDVKASNRDRVRAAREALEYYDRDSKKTMDEFDNRSTVLDQRSLALVEAANSIRNDEYQLRALAVAESARKMEHSFDALRETYSSTYDLQITFLNGMAEANGDLRRVSDLMREKLPEKKRLEAESDKLRKDEQEASQRLREQYAAFKGVTGVTLDYAEPPAQSPSNTPQ